MPTPYLVDRKSEPHKKRLGAWMAQREPEAVPGAFVLAKR
jgi:hypothetical protein